MDVGADRWKVLIDSLSQLSQDASHRFRPTCSVHFRSAKGTLLYELHLGDLKSPLWFRDAWIPFYAGEGVRTEFVVVASAFDALERYVKRYRISWEHQVIFRNGKKIRFYSGRSPVNFIFSGHFELDPKLFPTRNITWTSRVVTRRVTRVRLYSKASTSATRVPNYLVHAFRTSAFKGWSRQWIPWTKSKKLRSKPPSKDGQWLATYNDMFLRTVDDAIIIDSSSPVELTEKSRTSQRVLTPNFKSLKPSERPVNPYSMTEILAPTRFGYERVEDLDNISKTILTFVGPVSRFVSLPAPDFSIDPAAEGIALSRLIGPYGMNLSNRINSAESISTGNRTFRMIASSLSRVARAYISVKRGQFSSAAVTLFGDKKPRYRKGGGPSAKKSVASNWLEFQYGWKPLLNDIDYLIKDHFKTFKDPSLRFARSSARRLSTTESDIMGPLRVSLASVDPYKVGILVRTTETRVAYGISFKLSDPDKQFRAQTGLTSPVSLAWELLPFSFVVDWLYPIGPYLESLSAFEGLEFKGGYKTTFVREHLSVLINHDGVHGVAPQTVHVRELGASTRVSVHLERVKLTSFPRPMAPRFKNPFSVGHVANALALAFSAFKT